MTDLQSGRDPFDGRAERIAEALRTFVGPEEGDSGATDMDVSAFADRLMEDVAPGLDVSHDLLVRWIRLLIDLHDMALVSPPATEPADLSAIVADGMGLTLDQCYRVTRA